jgi:hypothetical protein
VRRVGNTTGGDLSIEPASKPGPDAHGDAFSDQLRRTSTRMSLKRGTTTQDPQPVPRRAVRDRWFYDPVPLMVAQGSSSVGDKVIYPSPKRPRENGDLPEDSSPSSCETDTTIQVSRRERATLLKEFKRCHGWLVVSTEAVCGLCGMQRLQMIKRMDWVQSGMLILKTKQKLWKLPF